MTNQPGRRNTRPQHGPEITLTDDERRLLTEAATRRGLTITAYIRMAAIDAAIRDNERIGNQMGYEQRRQAIEQAILNGQTEVRVATDDGETVVQELRTPLNSYERGPYSHKYSGRKLKQVAKEIAEQYAEYLA